MTSSIGLRRLPTFRNSIKWTGTIVFVVLLLVAIASRWWGIGWSERGPTRIFRVAAGFVAYGSHSNFGLPRGWSTYDHTWQFQRGLAIIAPRPDPYTQAFVPLWIPLVLVGFPTLLLWLTPRANPARSRWRGLIAALGVLLTASLMVVYGVAATSVGAFNVGPVAVGIANGVVKLSRATASAPPRPPTGVRITAPPMFAESPRNSFWPALPSIEANPTGGYVVGIPIWMPLISVGVPAVWFWFHLHRVRRGCCLRCGYDLTGNVSGRCSECGFAIGAL